MADMKIGIIGAGGRMGQACIHQIIKTDGCAFVAASDISGSPLIGRDAGDAAGRDAGRCGDRRCRCRDRGLGYNYRIHPAETNHRARRADGGREVAHIIGTTGMTAEQEAALTAAGEKTVIMHAPNMSLASIC